MPGTFRRHPRQWIVAAIMAVVVIAGGATAYAVTRDNSSGSADAGGGATLTAPSGPTLTLAQIAATVDPALVDITSQIGNVATAAGTGMILDTRGLILTNNHVISGGTSISVRMHATSRNFPATVVGYDTSDDVAVLKVSGLSRARAIEPQRTPVTVGSGIVVIGNALGRGGTPATQGVVTALNQTITAAEETGGAAETLHNMIQLSANVEPGDSGGAVADVHGRVVGMTTAAISASPGPSTMAAPTTTGFAIPIVRALSIAQQIESGAHNPAIHIGEHGLLDVDVVDGLGGVLVESVGEDSTASAAGLEPGDTITAVNGTPVGSTNALNTLMQGTHVGDKIMIEYATALGAQHVATVTITSGAG